MSHHVQCDECRREVREHMHLTATTDPAYGLSGPSRAPTDFCSWRCLSEYAGKQYQRKLTPRKPVSS